ncbi:phosphatidate cytidylyltransferase [Aureibacter tunicatorum]|uniref:Phosphatidate cytidylyltransferase n=1 Tax=Aureibacter tunicatorum TaxID=866807 RepID=A0AAE4BRH9_9BACT|nr:phosphatidate cytidylyltransferase [Aureibacter tunicatorum]
MSKFNNLTQRIITGIIGVVILISGIYWDEWTYFLLFLTLCIFTQREFYKLVGIDGQIPLKTFGTFCGAVLFTLIFLIEKGSIDSKYLFAIFPLLSVSYLVKLYKKDEKKPFTNLAFTFMGIVYIAVPISLINVIAFSQGGKYEWQMIVGLLLLLWASDTGAYFAGVNFGKRKLFERVSPKKSWEGFFGGALLSLGIACLISLYFTNLALWEWLCLSVITIIAGTYGDLVESLFKRSISIKDSASSIPGHGGFLDRFDGLLLATPFIVAFLKLL